MYRLTAPLGVNPDPVIVNMAPWSPEAGVLCIVAGPVDSTDKLTVGVQRWNDPLVPLRMMLE